MNKATISDRDVFDALKQAGHPLEECRRVVNERNAWVKFYHEIRDDFAQAAMPQIYVALRDVIAKSGKPVENVYELVAKAAYEQADAMLAERAKITKP